MKFELVRFYYSPQVKPAQRYHTDTARALQQLETLGDAGVEVEIFDVNEVADLFPHYHRATVGPKVAMRPVFGSKGALEEDFGRTVPALVCYESRDDLYPAEVYPRMDRDLERMLGINEVLDNLLAYGDPAAPAVGAPIPDEVELGPSLEEEEWIESETPEELREALGVVIEEEAVGPPSEEEVDIQARGPDEAPSILEDVAEEEPEPLQEPPTPEEAEVPEVVVPAEPRFAQPPPPPSRAPAQPPRRNGCLGTVIEWLVLLLLGAVLGTALTLGLLYAFNGTLSFSTRTWGRNVQSAISEAQSAIGEMQSRQAELGSDINALEKEADRLSQSLAQVSDKADTLEDYTGTIRNELETTKEDLGATTKKVETLRSDVKAVATESAQFDSFLTRLRDVLIEIQGTPVPTATPTPTNTSTPTATPTRTPTSSPTVTRTPTPRPTFTPRRTPTVAATATSAVELTVTISPTRTSVPRLTPTP